MAGAIIWYIVCFGCALLFYAIGAYAQRLKTPMHFWAGTKVDADTLTDVAAYNRENGRMWKWYSLWFWAAGLAEIWNSVVALILLLSACGVGLPILIGTYSRIFRKYRIS